MISPALAADLDHVLAHTAPTVWESLRGQRVIITGATGFFGRWLLESFAWANDRLGLGARVVAVSRDPAAFLRRAVHLERADIAWAAGNLLRLGPECLPPGSARFFIHAATEASAQLNAEAPQRMFDVCLEGTRRALSFARALGTTRFLFTSSGAVYGPQPPDLPNVPEDFRGGPDPLDPNSAYAEGKRAAELLCVLEQRTRPEFEPVIARGFAFVGPFLPLDAHFAVGNFLRDALTNGPIRVGGDGSPFRSYLHAADLAIWLWTMLVRAPACRAYNVGSPDPISISALAEAVAQCGGLPRSAVELARAATPGAPAARYVPATDRARSELGLEARLPLHESLARTFAALKAYSQ